MVKENENKSRSTELQQRDWYPKIKLLQVLAFFIYYKAVSFIRSSYRRKHCSHAATTYDYKLKNIFTQKIKKQFTKGTVETRKCI